MVFWLASVLDADEPESWNHPPPPRRQNIANEEESDFFRTIATVDPVAYRWAGC